MQEQAMTSTHTLTSVPAGRYRQTSRGNRAKVDRELLMAGSLFAVLVIVGTGFFFAVAPRIADLASLYVSTT
jgi:hypothetical protein